MLSLYLRLKYAYAERERGKLNLILKYQPNGHILFEKLLLKAGETREFLSIPEGLYFIFF